MVLSAATETGTGSPAGGVMSLYGMSYLVSSGDTSEATGTRLVDENTVYGRMYLTNPHRQMSEKASKTALNPKVYVHTISL